MNHENVLAKHGLKLGLNEQWIPNQLYHQGPGVSRSAIKTIITESPLHYKYSKDHPKPATEAMDVGQLFHTCVLEPEHMDRRFAVLPEGETYRKKENKTWRDEQIKAGKTVVRRSDHQDVLAMVESVRSHPAASAMLQKVEGISYEKAIYYVDPTTGLLCKIKVDVLINSPKLKLLADVKKCADASPAGFRKACGNFYYDMQAGMYLDGANHGLNTGDFESFVFICVENKPPYATACYEATPEMVMTGRELYMAGMEKFKECTASGIWPGYSNKISPVDLPAWRL